MIFSPADVTRHGAAASPQPESPPARLANNATWPAQRKILVLMIPSNQTQAARVNALALLWQKVAMLVIFGIPESAFE